MNRSQSIPARTNQLPLPTLLFWERLKKDFHPMLDYRLGERLLAWYLSSITGFIDAIGFIYLGGFFLSFMSGNTTRMTASASEGLWEMTAKGAGLMGLFLLGVMLGAMIQRESARRLAYGRPREVLLVFVSLASILSATLVTLGLSTPGVLTLSFVVGAMNSVFEKNGEVAISLTYATGTLVKMAQRFVGALYGEGHREWTHHLLLWLSLACGSILGGLCYMHLELHAIWVVAAAITGGATVAIVLRERRRLTGLHV